ncbi:V8-like Glu-specific endopeptidase [Neolewinella xylanilytica]|uniref:Serine protease n=2 Tax=Neolewinella xylanilytica TaxID=1514080 RepID=A0A2S6I3J7_9BACT|nr:V8-like Glu-specific endopeptidase [Neolewinella xylanilytica]
MLYKANGHTAVSSETSVSNASQESSENDGNASSATEATDTLESLGEEQLRESQDGSTADVPAKTTSDEYSSLEEFDRQDGRGGFSQESDSWFESDDEGSDDGQTPGGDGDGSGASVGNVAVEAYAASYPGQTTIAEVVIGRDDRKQVRDTTPFPYSAIVQLTIEAKNGRRYVGTGWLISPRTVITAGHCVYLHGAGGWPKSIQVTPAMNNATKPFGSCQATAFRSVRGWVSGKESDYDYGAIILPQQYPFGRKVGMFKFASFTDQTLLSKYVNICGYPGDKGGKTQWYHARRVSRLTNKRITYLIDTAGGQSGSPVFYRRDKTRVAVAIHTSGSMAGNSGTRINASVKANLERWAQEGK